MGLWNRVKSYIGGKRAITFNEIPEIKALIAGNSAGVDVNHNSALGIAAFWRGVNCYASTIGSLPRKVYEKVNKEKVERPDHYLDPIVSERTNPHMSDQVFFELVMHHALVVGNFYAEIEWNGAGKPVAMWPLNPRNVKPHLTPGGKLFYRYAGSKTVDLEAWRVFHIPGFGFDGYEGYSVVQIAQSSLGLAIASERFASAFYANGLNPGLVMEHPKELSSAARSRIEKSLRELLQGPDKAHGLLIMEEGAKASKMALTPEESQFLESRQYQGTEMARWLCLPLHKVGFGEAERPGGSLEASQTEFYTDSIRPWLVKIEKECNFKLLPTENKGRIFIEHVEDAILRGNSEARSNYYSKAIEGGWMTPETVASKENLPRPPKKEEPKPAHEPKGPETAPEPKRDGRLRAVALRDSKELLRIEANEARRAGAKLKEWAAEFYPKHAERMATKLAALGLDREFANDYCARHAAEIVAGDVETVLRGWEDKEPALLAERIAA